MPSPGRHHANILVHLHIIRPSVGPLQNQPRKRLERVIDVVEVVNPANTLANAVQVTCGMPEDAPEFPKLPQVQGHDLLGGPQMLQLR